MRRRKFVALLGAWWPHGRSMARAAEGDAGDRRPQPRVASVSSGLFMASPGTERSRLRRGTEFGDRNTAGGGAITIGCPHCRRSRRPQGRFDHASSPLALAENADSTIPIVFRGGATGRRRAGRQPPRPGGNLTGVSFVPNELTLRP